MSREKNKKNKKSKNRSKKWLEKAIVFRARRQGAASSKAIERFREKLLGQGAERSDIDAALEQAQSCFEEGDAHLFLCQGSSCKKRKLAKPVRKALKALGEQCRLLITETRCLGPCSHAPAAVLRVGEKSRFFVSLASDKSASALQSFIADGNRSRQRPVDSPGRPLRVESLEPLVTHLEPLRFMLGDYQGEALRATGTLDAGGRVLAVRLQQRTRDETQPVQSILYVVHWNEAIGELEARIYNSFGEVLDGPVRIEGDRVILPEIIPTDAPVGAVSARRCFRAMASGMACALEISRGGAFELWLQAEMTPRG